MASANEDSKEPEQEAGERAAALPDEPAAARDVVAQRYTLEGALGVGPLGTTFRAQGPEGRVVALKLVDPARAEDANLRRRLTRAVERASTLEHPHIAKVFEHGSDEVHGLFIAREFIDGGDLVTRVQTGALTPRRICDLFMQLLSALSEAHRHGVLHENLKPSNVLVTRDEQGNEAVHLCDFGNPLRARGELAYLAPEQRKGGPIDGQADVYAVGVLLYQLLTDALPHEGELLAPREKRPDRALPRELEAVCMKALALLPDERHRSPREMSQALRAVVSLLGPRADEPLGSNAFGEAGVNLAEEPFEGRATMPGEALRSRTKFWLGALLLAAVCVTVVLNPEVEPNPDPVLANGSVSHAARSHGEAALERGLTELKQGRPKAAVPELRNARRALGDVPEVLRPLGEALVLDNQRAEGVPLLARYLELEPQADDAAYVRSLIGEE